MTTLEILGNSDENVQKSYNLSGKYILKRLLKDYGLNLYPDKKRGDLNELFKEKRPQLLEKLKDHCEDCDPFATIGCYHHKFGSKKTALLFNTLLFDECCENFIKNVKENTIDSDTVAQIYRENHFSKLSKELPYSFQDPLLIVQSCIHPSHKLSSKIGSNLELAFIGDSVLDELLLREVCIYGFTNEQFDKCRQAVLNNINLVVLAVKFGFDKYRLVGPGVVNISWKSDADLFEALVGAVYLDSGRNMEIVRKVFYPFLIPSIEKCWKQ
uniref:RNase III domain-containing protein n=1 Tax=Panagrolaimus sp. ES5 TaxID=591445 RepID=A0AC34GBH0_9BILA